MSTTQPQTLRASGTRYSLRHFLLLKVIRWAVRLLTTRAAYVEILVIKSPQDGRRVPPRAEADAELIALLDEIPQWSNELLMHMHKRYGESRLFRVRHAIDGELTERAKILRNAVRTEMILRGVRIDDAE